MPVEGALDLAQLDPEAPELHLPVQPAQELELAVRAVSAPDLPVR